MLSLEMKELLLATLLLLIAILSAQDMGSHTEGDIRLRQRGRLHSSRGRVEMLHERKWRPLCQDNWTDRETRVLCKQLGFRSRGVALFGSVHGSGIHSVVPRIYKCRGRELNLTSCAQKHWREAKSCGPKHHVSVMCKVGRRDPEKLPIRIVDPSSESSSGVVAGLSGRVEIRYRGQWGSVCARKFGRRETKVVCNAVGMSRGRVLNIQKPGTGPIWLSRVKCNGSESSLLQCVRKSWGLTGRCTHKNDVVVQCKGPRIAPATTISKAAKSKHYTTLTVTTKSPAVTPTHTTSAPRIAETGYAEKYDPLTKKKFNKYETAIHHPISRGRSLVMKPDIFVKDDEIKSETKHLLREPDLEEIPDADVTREPVTDLDLAFVIDATGSMSSYINQAKQNIQEIARQISSRAAVNVRLALVEYRDHPPQDHSFISRQHDFSASVHDMQQWLDDCSANGGGDGPEAVADAMNSLLTLSWRSEATKVVVLIADAPPHGLALYGDALPNGCPVGHDPIIAAHGLAEMNIVLYTVGCEPSINSYTEFFAGLAYLTGGQYVPLGDAKLLASVIIGGAEEEISLQQWVPDVDIAVAKLLENADASAGAGMEDIDNDALIADVYAILRQRGATAKQLQRNNETLTPASNGSKEYAAMSNMTSARELFERSRSYSGVARGGYGHSRGMPEMAMIDGRGRSRAGGFAHKAMAFRPTHLDGMSESSMESDEEIMVGWSPSTSDKSYSAVEADIDTAQVERLIQRALAKRRKSATEA